MDIIKLSIPIFFALIGVELVVVRLLRRDYYRFNDSINDISTGIISQLTGVFITLLTLGAYLFVFNNISIQQLFAAPALPHVWWVWVLCFVIDDFMYYWFHRHSHETSLAWAAHVVHHQSEEYNLTVALRQSAFQGLFSWPYYLPLAFLGFPPEMLFTTHAINLLYQFWIHTRAIGKLPRWFEYIMNTPSHHRVHHGKNPKYCDKNHAGVFIIWDRMFGTFVEEEEEPVYGITVPLNSWNPVWANIGGMKSVFTDMWRARRWYDKIRIPFMKPGWKPADLGPSIMPRQVDRATYQKYDPPAPRSVNLYILTQFVSIIALTLYVFEVAKPGMPLLYPSILMFFIVVALTNLGGLHEGRAWAWVSELGRLLTLGIVAIAVIGTGYWLAGGLLLAFVLGAVVWLYALRGQLAGDFATA